MNIYTFKTTPETISVQRKLEHNIIDTAKVGNPYHVKPEEQRLLNLSYEIKTFDEQLPESIAKFYKLEKVEQKALGWLNTKDHPDGLLGRPCPVCGYKYGSRWLYRPIPAEDEAIILKLLEDKA